MSSKDNLLNDYILYLLKEIKSNWKIQIVLFLSILMKAFFCIYYQGAYGPDAAEYLDAAQIFRKLGIGYIFSEDPATFWRLPFYPLFISLVSTQWIISLIQLILTYLISYYLFLVFNHLGFGEKVSLVTSLFALFIPYINISASSIGPELLQVLFFIYLTKKILFDERDLFLAIAFSCFILLRPEGFVVLLFVLARDLYFKKYKITIIYVLPLVVLLSWQFRNFCLFDSFSLVNPIHPSRSVIGSIYSVIYVVPPHPFHEKWNYYEGKDYLNKKEFVKQYKHVVNEEIKNYIFNNPLGYIKHRLFWVGKCFSYVSFGGERLPDKNWHIKRSKNFEEVVLINSNWSFKSLIAERDYFRLALRLIYHSIFLVGHFVGIFFILLKFNRFKALIFVFSCFSYIFVVEADMRYFLFIQLICLSVSFSLLIDSLNSKFRRT